MRLYGMIRCGRSVCVCYQQLEQLKKLKSSVTKNNKIQEMKVNLKYCKSKYKFMAIAKDPQQM